jgi:dienelactone hydrolase
MTSTGTARHHVVIVGHCFGGLFAAVVNLSVWRFMPIG